MIRVQLPFHLRTLAHCDTEIELEVTGQVTALSVIETLERMYPTLRGAILERDTRKRRPKIRFFACKEDISHEEMSTALPTEIVNGSEPLIIVGAISGG